MLTSRLATTRPTVRVDPRTIRVLKWGGLLAALAAVTLAYLLADGVRGEVTRLAAILGRGDAAALRDALRAYGVWGPVVSVAAMIAQALVAPIPAFLVVFANGLAYGAVAGWGLSLAGQTAAATVCFWLARGLGRAPVEALAGRLGLGVADQWVARWGLLGLFLTRLVPGIGFDGVSYAAGLTGLGFWPFALVTIAGSAPQLLLYSYLGETAPRAAWLLLAATVAVSVAGGGVALAVAWRRRRHAKSRGAAPHGVGSLPLDVAAACSSQSRRRHDRRQQRADRDEQVVATPLVVAVSDTMTWTPTGRVVQPVEYAASQDGMGAAS